MNGTLGSKQAGSYNSGVLGAIPVAQPQAYRSGSLGAYKQPGAVNSGSLGFHEPGVVNSGVLGEYFAANGLGATVPQAGAYRSGSLGEYYAAQSGLGASGCGCSGGAPQNGLGATMRFFNPRRAKAVKGLGAVSLDLDMIVGIAGGAALVWFAMGGKCGV